MTLPSQPSVEGLSGERFRVVYDLFGDESTARNKANDICLEQTVEFPADLVPEGDIHEQIVGQIEDFAQITAAQYRTTISFAIETAGAELTQLLNVIFGNISIKPGIRVQRFDLPEALLQHFKGPRFGQQGWRDLLKVPERPLLMTALKPMGLSNKELANIAHQFALGGIDIIKDDHGLANQPFSRFQERVERCAAAVAEANAKTGLQCMYMPNVTAPANEVMERAHQAKTLEAGSLLICPGLMGFDAMRAIADDDDIALPISSHPAFYGAMVTSPTNGMSHYALYGQLQRLAGADSSIYPNFGGRFSFSEDECRSIAKACSTSMHHFNTIFPTPGGGMNMKSIPHMQQVYGNDVIYLVGGGLHRHSNDLVANARHFVELVS